MMFFPRSRNDRRRISPAETARRRRRALSTRFPEALEARLLLSSAALLADINPDGASSSTANQGNAYDTDGNLTAGLNGTLVFQQIDAAHGSELWKSSGTSADTALVSDIDPGTDGSAPHDLTTFHGKVYFVANSGSGYFNLFRTDGTTAGTGPVYSSPYDARQPSGASGMTAAGTDLYYVNSNNLIEGDGTTFVTLGSYSSTGQSSFNYGQPTSGGFTAVGNSLYFWADDGSHGRRLYSSNGTNLQMVAAPKGSGVNTVEGIGGGSTSPFLVAGNNLYFQASDGVHGNELWVLNTTTNTAQMVQNFTADTQSGGNDSFFDAGAAIGNTAYLSVASNDSPTVAGLYAVNGTSTQLVGSQGYLFGPQTLTAIGNLLYITDNYGNLSVDNIPAGTISPIQIRTDGTAPNVQYQTVLGTSLYFWANDGKSGTELWKTDGSTSTTVRVADINSGPAGSLNSQSNNTYNPYPTVVGNDLFFWADDGIHGRELWKTDPASGTTGLVDDITPGGDPSNPFGFTTAGNQIFFIATSGTAGNVLGVTDGTPGGTHLVQGLPAGATIENGTTLTAEGSKVVFQISDTYGRNQFWISDGTAAGTVAIGPLGQGYSPYNVGPVSQPIGGVFYFSAGARGKNGNSASDQVYVSDGTAAGTHVVHALTNASTYNGAIYQQAGDLTASNGRLFFIAQDSTASSDGYELWTIDPTSGDTVMVKDIDPGSADGLGANNTAFEATLTPFGTGVIFPATDGVNGVQLWSSDGTAAGTQMIKALNTISAVEGGNADPSTPVVSGGYAYFAAFDGTTQPDDTPSSVLWRTNGTAAGTVEIRAFSNVYSFVSKPFNGIPLNTVGNELLYEINGQNDAQSYLAALDMTTLSSTNLSNMYPSGAATGAHVGGSLYFIGEGANAGGYDLWRTDGTAAGTVPASTGNTGTAYTTNYTYYSTASPASLGSSVIFAGNDGLHGMEPMVLAPQANTGTYTYGAIAYVNNVLTPGAPGVFTALDNVDDGAAAVDLGSNRFNFYGKNYTGTNALYVSSNGLITFGAPDISPTPTTLGSDTPLPSIAPWWRDWTTALSANDQVLAKFDDTNGDGVPDRLILQWTQVGSFGMAAGSTPATFQAILQLNTGSVLGAVTFNYANTATNDRNANAADGVVGLASGANAGLQRLVVSDEATSPLVGSGQAIEFFPEMIAKANGGYSVNEGSSATLSAASSMNASGAIVSYAWDFNYNGTSFVTDATGASPTFSAAMLDGPSTRDVALKITDSFGNVSMDEATVTVLNVAPTPTLAATSATLAGGVAFTTTGSFADPGTLDTWTATVDYGDGSGAQPLTLGVNKTFSLSHSYNTQGNYTVTVRVTDKDGGVGTALATVHVTSNAAAPPRVTAAYINNGPTNQRSVINYLTVYFSSVIKFVGYPTNAFTLTNTDNSQTEVVSVSPTTPTAVVTIGFAGGPDVVATPGGNRLFDGHYLLAINAADVVDYTTGQALDGTNSGQSGNNFTYAFYQFFGDYNGDGNVDATDRLYFNKTYGLTSSSPNFIAAFDWNGDGVIDDTDKSKFNYDYTKRHL